ncbi:hypothetical protein FNF29_03991 [Cafeteria roenbergensis]|uniref:Uncharacterized protein n=1 Tax=Cafeteria roenbergensis TaxID=33653 RepID=A0A5A8CHA8_CAFRO|nr:hypothetical protein FNF29_03991 [Cafeteria roenbergensis]|eukprot:KAA0152425.1 hypothetical protein FNF29_03991 [Cafeteria roenbergensis]
MAAAGPDDYDEGLGGESHDDMGVGAGAAYDGAGAEAGAGAGRPRWAGAADDPLQAEAEAGAGGAIGGEAGAAIEAALAGVDHEDDMEDLDHELPEFASKEARDTMAAIHATEAKVERAEEAAAAHRERIRVMEEHLANVKQEVSHTEAVLASRKKELASEDHLKQLAEREIGRIRQELKELETRGEDVADKVAATQADIHKGTARLEAVQEELHVTLEDLKAWTEARRQKDEDNKALERYTKADEGKLKELSMALERLTQQVASKKRALEEATTETAAKQIELDKAADDFHALHQERGKLLKQVDDAVASIRGRDREILEANERAAEGKRVLETRKAEIRAKAEMLEGLEVENGEAERLNGDLARRVGAHREQLRAAQEALRELEDEAELNKSELGKAAAQLGKSRSELDSLRAQKEAYEQRLEAAVAKEAAVVASREKAKGEATKLEGAAERREADLKAQEARLVSSERELEQAKAKLFKESQRRAELVREEGVLRAEISGAESAAKNLSTKMRQLDADAARQAELLYAAEFQIQAMERKLARVKGEVSDEERKRLEARIADLNLDLGTSEGLKAKLEAQLKQLADEQRRVQRRRESLEADLTALHGTLAELRLQTSAGETQLAAAVKGREEAQVAHDIVKLDVRRLREALTSKTDEVFGLENRHQQLQLSIAERRKEIEVHTKLQRAQAKLAEEERHRVALDLRKREARVAGLQRKYDALCAKMRGASDGDDDDGEPKTQAYFVIKAAQQREELQREGDELNAAVLTAEREARALTATLAQLQRRNTAYRESFQKADPRSRDAETVATLETLGKDSTEAMYRRKRELQDTAAATGEAKARAADLAQRRAALQSQLQRLRGIAADVQAQRDDQVAAVEEAKAAVRQAVQELRRAAPPSSVPARVAPSGGDGGDDSDGDRDGAAGAEAEGKEAVGDVGVGAEATAGELRVKAAAMEHGNASVLFTLGQLAREFPQLTAPLRAALRRKGLQIPARVPKRTAASTAASLPMPDGGRGAAAAASAGGPRGAGPSREASSGAAAPGVAVRTFDLHV